MKQNLHSHTQFCDGRVSMEEMLRSAHNAGFDIWGFSPHAPLPIPSPCNMKEENVEPYLREIDRLRLLFPDMKIMAGMEVDYLNDSFGPSSPEIRDYGLDYVIGSVHFIPNQEGVFHDIDGRPENFKKTLHEHFKDDLMYVVATFWTQTQKMITAGGFDIIGHIDKIALNASSVDPFIEETPEYRSLADKTLTMAIRSGKSVEINTKHLKKYGRFFPNPRYWPKLISAGVSLPVNSDTHYAECVEEGIKEALEKLKIARQIVI